MSRRFLPQSLSTKTKLATLLLGAVIGAACANPDRVTGKTTDGTGSTLLIRAARDTTVAADTLLTGEDDWLQVRGVDSTAATKWSVSDSTIIRIEAQAGPRVHVRALKIGQTTITAQHDGETGTYPLVVRDTIPSDTMPRVEITTGALDSLIVGDSIYFAFNLENRKGQIFNDRPFQLRLSDSSVAQLVSTPMSHTFFIAGVKLGQTTITVTCACRGDSTHVTVHEPRATVPDPRASRYEAIDLGTLGGQGTVPLALNDSGDVVGYSFTADGRQHAFLWSKGVMQDLSPGDQEAIPYVVSNSRVVAGTSQIGGTVHVVRWENGQATDLGPVASSDPQAEVVGITATEIVARGASGSAIWRDGVKQYLSGFQARAINSHHQIAGTIGQYPYLWDNGSLVQLEIPTSPGEAVDINTPGDVLGDIPSYPFPTQIVVWSHRKISRYLAWIHPVAINDLGDVIGHLSGQAAMYPHDGGPTHIPDLGPRWGTVVMDLNDRAMVVGSSWTTATTRHAFVWQLGDSTSIDLGTGPVTTERTGSAAVAINTRGDILGWVAPCTTPSGRCTDLIQTQAHAVLWRLRN